MDTASWYRYFADVEAAGSSPSYRVLADGIADDDELIGWIDRLPPARRQPNLLLASVQFLGGATGGWTAFRLFVDSRWDDIEGLMQTRSTQTNEAARCSAFIPVLASLPQPIALIEVGASAGLCLFPDRYGYSYDGVTVGDSPLRIDVTCTGPVPTPTELPEVCWRRGIDLHPLDVTSTDDVGWLRACIWPEHHGRRERLALAATIAAEDSPVIVSGDLVEQIGDVVGAAPDHATKVVFHSAVLSYLTAEQRMAFAAIMGERPDVVWISNEAPGVVPGVVAPSTTPASNAFVLGRNGATALAFTDPHGTWLDWISPT